MNRARRPSAASYADLALDRFRNWPLRVCRADTAPGRALALDRSGVQIAHFHLGNLAEVRLTRATIGRLAPALRESGRVDLVPDGDWVQVHLDTGNDLFLLESLVSLAIQANDPALHTRADTDAVAACPYTVTTAATTTTTTTAVARQRQRLRAHRRAPDRLAG